MAITINGTGSISGISAGGLPDGSVTPADLSQPLTLATAQASTSGTYIDFTGIPSWVKRITVMLNGVSINATSNGRVQIGTSSGIETSGYASGGAYTGTGTGGDSSTSGFVLFGSIGAGDIVHGICIVTLVGSNTWVASLTGGLSGSYGFSGGGSKTLAGTLDRIRITTSGGTATFDAGSINIMYE